MRQHTDKDQISYPCETPQSTSAGKLAKHKKAPPKQRLQMQPGPTSKNYLGCKKQKTWNVACEVWIHGWDVSRGWTKACMGWPQLRCCQRQCFVLPLRLPLRQGRGVGGYIHAYITCTPWSINIKLRVFWIKNQPFGARHPASRSWLHCLMNWKGRKALHRWRQIRCNWKPGHRFSRFRWSVNTWRLNFRSWPKKNQRIRHPRHDDVDGMDEFFLVYIDIELYFVLLAWVFKDLGELMFRCFPWIQWNLVVSWSRRLAQHWFNWLT